MSFNDYNFMDGWLARERLAMSFMPRYCERPRSEFHEHMLEHEMDRFQYYRPAYIDGPEAMGFIQEPHDWGTIYKSRDPNHIGVVTNCMEIAYWGTSIWWKTLGRAMKHAFWAEVHRSMGTMQRVSQGSERSFAIIKGLTS